MLYKDHVKILAVLLVVMTLTQAAYSQSKVGTTAVPFLGISVGPRATAMGSAFTAVANDASALYYNPGAISQMPLSQASIAHTEWLVGTSLNWVGFVLNLDGQNAIGVSLTYLNYGDEMVTTVTQPEGTGEMWNAADMSIGLSYARSLTDRFSIGGSAKYVQEKIWHESASAFAMDVGLLFYTGFKDLKLGMSISNFGTELKMDGRELLQQVDLDPDHGGHNETIVANLKTAQWPLPLFFRVGLAMNVINTPFYKMLVAVDALRPTDNSEVINVGTEWAIYDMFFLRGGYKSLFRDDSEEGLTAGVGFVFSQGGAMNWNFDYTWADFGLFQPVQMFSISVAF